MVSNLLDFQKIRAQKFELNNEPVNVFELFESLCNMHKQKAQEQGCKLQLWLDKGSMPTFLNLDQGRLIQVLTNMLSNAIKFSPTRG